MLSVQDLHKSYQVGKTTYEVLKGVSLEVAKGEFVAVMGPSGSGKTTLLNCISCYIPADSGSIRLGSQELARLDEDTLAAVRNKKLGFVFQDFLLLDGLTVRDNILLPRIIAGETGGDMEQAADRLCGIFGSTCLFHFCHYVRSFQNSQRISGIDTLSFFHAKFQYTSRNFARNAILGNFSLSLYDFRTFAKHEEANDCNDCNNSQ